MKDNDDALTDYLSDEFGYCIFNLNQTKIKGKHFATKINWDTTQNGKHRKRNRWFTGIGDCSSCVEKAIKKSVKKK